MFAGAAETFVMDDLRYTIYAIEPGRIGNQKTGAVKRTLVQVRGKELDFALETIFRIRGVDHIEQELRVAGLLEFRAIQCVGFIGAGPIIAADRAFVGFGRMRCADEFADFLDRIGSAQVNDFDRAVRHVFGRAVETGRAAAGRWEIEIAPLRFGEIVPSGEQAFGAGDQAKALDPAFDVTIELAPERIRFDHHERILFLSVHKGWTLTVIRMFVEKQTGGRHR